MNPTDPQSRPPASSPSSAPTMDPSIPIRSQTQTLIHLGYRAVTMEQVEAAIKAAEATSQWMKLVGNSLIYETMDGSSPRSGADQNRLYKSWTAARAAIEAWDAAQ